MEMREYSFSNKKKMKTLNVLNIFIHKNSIRSFLTKKFVFFYCQMHCDIFIDELCVGDLTFKVCGSITTPHIDDKS